MVAFQSHVQRNCNKSLKYLFNENVNKYFTKIIFITLRKEIFVELVKYKVQAADYCYV